MKLLNYLLEFYHEREKRLVNVVLRIDENDISPKAVMSPAFHNDEFLKFIPNRIKKIGELVDIKKIDEIILIE